MANFDLANLAVSAIFPANKLIVDDAGMPSVMVFIPKFKMSEVITGGSDSVHPAFIVDGVEKDGFWAAKYQCIMSDSYAYSLPCEDPKTSVNADTARGYCENKGTGWHMMSAAEWGAIALWCKKNGFLPYGNNNYGKDSRESNYVAIPKTKDATHHALHVATGTGPVTWAHNKQLDGIYDLNGNVSEWADGLRLVNGELQILANNNSAKKTNSKAASSDQWKAIDGTTGNLITPDGSGTTANSIKLEWTGSVWKWQIAALTAANKGSHNCAFVSVTIAADITSSVAKELLYALAMAPDDTSFDYEGDYFYADTSQSERFLFRGGYCGDGTWAGVFFTCLNYDRGFVYGTLGFRSAFIE